MLFCGEFMVVFCHRNMGGETNHYASTPNECSVNRFTVHVSNDHSLVPEDGVVSVIGASGSNGLSVVVTEVGTSGSNGLSVVVTEV